LIRLDLVIKVIISLMLSGWRASDRMFEMRASRLSVSYERHSVMMCLIERGVLQLAHNGGSSFFIRYWCVSNVCPIRILLTEVSSSFIIVCTQNTAVFKKFEFEKKHVYTYSYTFLCIMYKCWTSTNIWMT
jgi:hypothetical protein